jgi:hypothetical protein
MSSLGHHIFLIYTIPHQVMSLFAFSFLAASYRQCLMQLEARKQKDRNLQGRGRIR